MKKLIKLVCGALLLLFCGFIFMEDGFSWNLFWFTLIGLALMGVGGLSIGRGDDDDDDDPEEWNKMVDQVNAADNPEHLDRLAKIFGMVLKHASDKEDDGAEKPPLGELVYACEEKAEALRNGLPTKDLSHLRIS